MEWQQDGLVSLQRQLKKQFLLVQKQQQEKVKLKRQIQQLARNYHALLVQTDHPSSTLLKDQGFENCYNFVKDVVVGISVSPALGAYLLKLAQPRSRIAPLIVNTFYQSLQTSDFQAKDITKLMHSLLSQMGSSSEVEREKIIEAWRMYMNKPDHDNYFQQIAKDTLIELLKETPPKQEHRKSQQNKQNQVILVDNQSKQLPQVINIHKRLAEQFMLKVAAQSQLCPPSIKLPLKGLVQSLSSDTARVEAVWRMTSSFYLQPFIMMAKDQAVPSTTRQRILQFVTEMTSKMQFCAEISPQPKPNFSYGQKVELICLSLMQVRQQTYGEFRRGGEKEGKIQIRLFGACLSLSQLRQLLVLINGHRQALGKISDKVATRTQKIFEMSPALSFLRRQNEQRLFVSLIELRYQQSISSDYYKGYTQVYRGDNTKYTLKTVLVQLQNCLNIFPQTHSKTLPQMFELILNHSQGVYALSPQLQMKVKYLLYLLKQPQNKNINSAIIKQMRKQLADREIVNTKLFEDTKFSLFKVYSNLRSMKVTHLRMHQTQAQTHTHLTLIKQLQQLKVDLCVTSRASRNHQTAIQSQSINGDSNTVIQNQQERYDRYRYRLASADEIVVSSVDQCIHKDNSFRGINSHGSTISKAIRIFANLPQIKYFLHNPSFASTKHTHQYSYCSQSKIRQAFISIIRAVQKHTTLQYQNNSILEDVLYRYLGGLLLGQKHAPSIGHKDRLLGDKIEERRNPIKKSTDSPNFNRQSPNKRADSPNKRLSRESGRKRRGSHSDIDSFILLEPVKAVDSGMRHDQLVQMGARYILSVSQELVPSHMMRKLREMIDLYRLMRGSEGSGELQDYLVDVIVAARPCNLITTLGYLETYLPDQKLMSSQGKILKQLQKAVMSIVGTFERTNRFIQRSRIAEC